MKNSENIPRRPGMSGWRGILLCCLFLAAPLTDLLAGVLVAPTVIVLSEQNRTGRMLLRNPGPEPAEVSVRMSFGITQSDSLGQVYVELQDSAITDPRSAAGWIRPFPRRVVLPPGAEQTVRFVARPPSDLPDGEYWARVVVRSEASNPPEPVEVPEGEISARINTVMQTAISLKYRTGDLNSQVELSDAEVSRTDSLVKVMIDLANKGNVSYLGMLNCRLLDADGKEISAMKEHIAVYYDLRRGISLPVTNGEFRPPFQVELDISTEGRKDMPASEVIPGNRIEYSMAVE